VVIVVEATGTISSLDNTSTIRKQSFFDIIISCFKKVLFAGSPPLGTSTSRESVSLTRGFREETSTSAIVDTAELDVLYHNLPSYQPEPTVDSRMAEETVVVEPIALPAESVDDTVVVSLTSPILAATGLRIITSPASPT